MATILVIDDDPAILDVLSEILEDAGYRVVVANNGREGLAAVAAERPDLVLTDIAMPVMDGYALSRALRADPRWFTLPVLLMSGAKSTEAARQAAQGAILSKPIDIDLLIATVARCLSLSGAAP